VTNSVTACLSVNEGSVKLDVTVTPGSGQFEISENESVVASGRISLLTESPTTNFEASTPTIDAGPLPLNSDDIYKELRLRGYDYGPTFRGILSADGTGNFFLFGKLLLSTAWWFVVKSMSKLTQTFAKFTKCSVLLSDFALSDLYCISSGADFMGFIINMGFLSA